MFSHRGAFQAEELEVVGALYNRIKLFVDEVEAKSNEKLPMMNLSHLKQFQRILLKSHQLKTLKKHGNDSYEIKLIFIFISDSYRLNL